MTVSYDNINPHMKFTPPSVGVVVPPQDRVYSLNAELKKEDQYYKKYLRNIDRKTSARFSDRHPTLSKNISDLVKLTSFITAGVLGYRYRHSIPLLKNICRAPKNTPPNFVNDLKALWEKIIK